MGPAYLALGVAIVAEVIATSFLRATDGFTKPLPTLAVVVGYGVAFYCLTMALRDLPTGVAYAVWSGAGTVLITLVGWLWYRQQLDAAALAGMGLIVAGVAVINLWSGSAAH